MTSFESGGKMSSSVTIGRPNRSNFGAVVSIGGGVDGCFNSSTIDFFFLTTFLGIMDFGAPKPPPAKHEEVKVTLAVDVVVVVRNSSAVMRGEFVVDVMVDMKG